MGLAWKQFRVYVRGAVVFLLGVAIALVLFYNRNHEAPVWFFGLTDAQRPVNVVWLMVCTAGAALITGWAIRAAWRIRRDWQEVYRVKSAEEAKRQLAAREASVAQREKAINEQQAAQGQETKPARQSREVKPAPQGEEQWE